jgi:hypothetical protein
MMHRKPMAQAKYHEILSKHLTPMFAGAELEASSIACDVTAEMVIPEAADAVLVRPDVVWPRCFRINRKQPFEADDIKIIKRFIRAFGQKLVAAGEPFFDSLIDMCSQDVVAWSVQHGSMDNALLPGIIAVMQKWASQTYEGARISVSMGVDPSPVPSRISEIHLSELIRNDYAKVLSNGMDTLLVLSPSGHVVEHLALTRRTDGGVRKADSYTPSRYLSLADWAGKSRVALALNRHGEILVFKKQRLQFAFRRGNWCHFPHEAMIARMSESKEQTSVIRAVYSSCLDISFARTGACIAVSNGNSEVLARLVNTDDLLSESIKGKSALLRHLIGQRFQNIPRPIRQEIGALDGAVLLDARGAVLAAGAIVRVPGGSEGGGRRAAAKALSRLGLAVKVSADGAITAFTDRGPKDSPEIAFELCI